MIVADTDVLIDFLAAREPAAIWMADSLIAGIALHVGGTLLTRNQRHFERVEGLDLARFE
jgi:predicted nucleic acid-binding protein